MSHKEGPKIKLWKSENQAFAEFKYLEKTNYMVAILYSLVYTLLEYFSETLVCMDFLCYTVK